MSRSEFMFLLAQLLADMPLEERAEALKFYNNYFDDAGPENEQQVIEELGTPQKVADSIKGNLNEEEGYFSKKAYEQESYNNQGTPYYEQPAKRKIGVGTIILIVLASPFIIVLASVIFAILVSVFAVVFSAFVAVSASAIACIIYGIGRFIIGILDFGISPGQGLLSCGISLMVFAIGVMLVVGSIWLWGVACPKFCKWIGSVCKKMFSRRKNP